MLSIILAVIIGFLLFPAIIMVSVLGYSYDDARDRFISNSTSAFLIILIVSVGLPPLKPFLLNIAAFLFGTFLGITKEKFDELYNTANGK